MDDSSGASGSAEVWSLRVMSSAKAGGNTVVVVPCVKSRPRSVMPAALYAAPLSSALRILSSSVVPDMVENGTRTAASIGRPRVSFTPRVMTSV